LHTSGFAEYCKAVNGSDAETKDQGEGRSRTAIQEGFVLESGKK